MIEFKDYFLYREQLPAELVRHAPPPGVAPQPVMPTQPGVAPQEAEAKARAATPGTAPPQGEQTPEDLEKIKGDTKIKFQNFLKKLGVTSKAAQLQVLQSIIAAIAREGDVSQGQLRQTTLGAVKQTGQSPAVPGAVAPPVGGEWA